MTSAAAQPSLLSRPLVPPADPSSADQQHSNTAALILPCNKHNIKIIVKIKRHPHYYSDYRY